MTHVCYIKATSMYPSQAAAPAKLGIDVVYSILDVFSNALVNTVSTGGPGGVYSAVETAPIDPTLVRASIEGQVQGVETATPLLAFVWMP